MKDKLYVKTILDEVCNGIYPQSLEGSQIHEARVKNMYWAYNNGELRTENEMTIAIRNAEEEMIGYSFANDLGINYKIAEAKLKDLQKIV